MIKDHYQWMARLYDPVIGRFNRFLREVAMSMLPPCEGASVLDVRCGTGMHLEHYSSSGCRISGIDLSPSMLAIARKRLGDAADLREADAREMPFEDGAFDVVLASLFLHELPPDVRMKVLEEMLRVMKPEARMLITDFHPGPFTGFKGHRMNAAITIAERFAGREHFRNSRIFLASQGMVAIVEELGMETIEMKVIAGGTMGFYLIRKGAH